MMLEDVVVYGVGGGVVGLMGGGVVLGKEGEDGEVIVEKGKEIVEEMEGKVEEVKKK